MPLTSLTLALVSGAPLPLAGRFPLALQVSTAVDIGQWMDLRTFEAGVTWEVAP